MHIHEMLISWAAKLLYWGCVCVCVCVCLSVRDDFVNTINSTNIQPISCKFYIWVEAPWGKFDTLSTRTNVFAAKRHSVSPKSLKCNISISNCPIALKFDTVVKYLKLHIQNCQLLDEHPYKLHSQQHFLYPPPPPPQSFKCTYGPIRALEGKYDQMTRYDFLVIMLFWTGEKIGFGHLRRKLWTFKVAEL